MSRPACPLLAYSARTWDEIIFRDELLRAEADDRNLRLVVTTTREPRHRPADAASDDAFPEKQVCQPHQQIGAGQP